ncbi:sensor histidine kinase [Gardnerella sp. KA00255]|uniref:sensor histidine kinase n=1 Tax=Gardnerella sp. KA00255 TaxID=2749073 RepID=UPI003BAA0085
MPIDSSTLVFIAFAVLALCVLLGLFMLMADYVAGIFRGIFRWIFCKFSKINVQNIRFNNLFRFISVRRTKLSDRDNVSDDVSNDAQFVLAMLHTATIVVDSDDEVIRASSQAYTLGVVVDDAIVQPRVLDAISVVRKKGGSERFSIVTSTPAKYITIEEDPTSAFLSNTSNTSNSSNADFPNGTANPSNVDPSSANLSNTNSSLNTANSLKTSAATITRPNWLTVTVGAVGKGIVVVIIEDTSAAHRFAQTREDFIENVSQQLISSTRTLSNLTNVLQNENVSTEKIKDIARSTGKSSKRLEHMLEDLLLLMRAQNPINPDDSNVLSIENELNEVQKQVSPLALDCNVKVKIESDSSLKVSGYADQICAAIRKLVENAIIYSRENSVVSVSAKKSSDGNYAVIRVVDCGAGIPLENQSRIFERFYRSNNQNNRSQEGVGLGLAIAKHVALTHNGSITLWSRPGQGTTVSLALPLYSR